MRAIALTVALLSPWLRPTEEEYLDGYATYMDYGVMDKVISNRGLQWSDGVALNRAGDRGREVWLLWGDGTISGPLKVVDCAQRIHFGRREQWGHVVEVSAELAQERGFYGIGKEPVTVLFEAPERMWH